MTTTTDLQALSRSRLEELFLQKLPARTLDIVSLVDEILAVAQEAGGLECTLSPERHLRFCIPGHSAFDIPIERPSMLRSICARLGTLSIESGHDVNLYGGEGFIRRELTCKSNGRSDVTTNFQLRFHNTSGQPDFALTAQ